MKIGAKNKKWDKNSKTEENFKNLKEKLKTGTKNKNGNKNCKIDQKMKGLYKND